MRYFFVANDGSKYGPVDDQTLRRWADEKRILPDSKLIEDPGGRDLTASQLPWLFAAEPPPRCASHEPPYAVPRVGATSEARAHGDWGKFWGAIVQSGLAVLLFFVLHGLGLVFGGYAVYSGIQCVRSGHKLGAVALIVSLLAMAAVCVGWVLRLKGAAV